jgi:class 3 adenylate cyclase
LPPATFGPVVPRDGDYFGAVVNLAARLVADAPPGQVLVTRAVADELADGDLTPLVTRRVRGFDEPVEVFLAARSR